MYLLEQHRTSTGIEYLSFKACQTFTSGCMIMKHWPSCMKMFVRYNKPNHNTHTWLHPDNFASDIAFKNH